MPSTLTYPGVYVEEIASGVRTITGVSTSVTAFVGSARRGPINQATRMLSFSDFERRFGGLSANSELSYAVRQFFTNGGSEAWVVRLAKDAGPAARILQNSTLTNVLELTAQDEGFSGNGIEVRIDTRTANPASTFNLTLSYTSQEAPDENRSETFQNLSMNSHDARYVENILRTSQLAIAKRVASLAVLAALGAGTSLSDDLASGGALVDVATLKDANHDQFQVSVNGSPPVPVQIADADLVGANDVARLAALCTAITAKVTAAAGSNPLVAGFTCAPDGNRIRMTSGVAGEASSVRVLPGARNDLSARLKLGTANGGAETDAVATLRPVELPDHGTLTGDVLVAADVPANAADPAAIPSPTHNSFKISLDGDTTAVVNLGNTAVGGGSLGDRLGIIADRIQTAVRALKPSKPAYRDFTATVSGGNRLVLTSGSRGAGSSVVGGAADSSDIAGNLKLLVGATTTLPQNVMLQGGTESAFTADEAYNLFIGNRSLRKGIYALESVDLFNILCLPGVSDAGILQDADAYCQERRAFLIIDPPEITTKPDAMGTLATGSSLPKSKNAAVYYPWISVADPLNGGKLRNTAPSGALAGLYARTDATRGVWKAPAGTEATLGGAQGVAYLLTDGENGTLNPLGVNCIRSFPVFGTISWGARTLRGADQMADEWKYVPVRRTALYIEESLYRGLKWVVFEPNDEPLWAQIRLNAGAFMHNLFRQGAFAGKTPREAYFVKCDRETTTQNDVNLGIVNILVGFAPLKPAEFVIIKLQQMAGQIEA
ncbi:MAG: phage tail sheath subtilisin-like domain-containing protein [Anaerolineae bacterium]|nr:phage tail sheath subtilisin-like domain-containing protein [Anaerolineae bacterium]